MREDFKKYTCDQCNNKMTVVNGAYAGTPLSESWVRVYMKLRPIDVQKSKLHFCSTGCVANYMMDRA